MQKKNNLITDYAQQAIVFLFHLLVLTVPFFFTWVNEELFEFNKMVLVYGYSILISVFWVWRMIVHKKIIFKRSYLDWALLFFLVSQILSTVFSIHPRTSIFGYYTRFHGGLLSTLSYLTLYYALISNFSRKHLKKLLFSVFLAGMAVALYSIPEHFGHSPSCLLITGEFNVDCWVQKVQDRVFGTFGQPNWLAAYAVLLLPVGAALFINRQLAKSGSFSRKLGLLAGLSVVGLILTLLFTQSRSAFLGLVVSIIGGTIGLAVLYFRDFKNQQKKFPLGNFGLLLALVISLIAYFGSPYTPSLKNLFAKSNPSPIAQVENIIEQPAANRLDLGGTDSGEIRKIVWTGALKVWQRYPLFGSGVETFAYSYYQDRPLAHNLVSEWDFLYNKAHNELLNFLATTGIVGLTAYLGIFVVFAIKAVRFFLAKDEKSKLTSDKILTLGFALGLTSLFVSNFLGFSTVTVSLLMFIFLAIFAVLIRTETLEPSKIQFKPDFMTYLWLFLSGLAGLMLLMQVMKIWHADYLFTKGSRLVDAGNFSAGGPYLQKAIELRPDEDLFYDKFATTLTQATFLFAEQKKLPEAQSAAQSAIIMSNTAIKLNPVNLNLYKTRIRLLSAIGTLDPELLTDALETTQKAMKLAPTDPKLVFNLGLINQALGNEEEALSSFVKAIEMKDDYVQVRKYLADFYQGKNQLQLAYDQLQRVIHYFPEDTETKDKIATLEAMLAPRLK